MKLFICFAFLLISAKECDNKTQASDEATTSQTEMRRLQENVKVSYRASTRGFFEVIEIEGDSIRYTNDYNLEKFETFAIPERDKEEFYNLLSQLDVESLSEIKAPSKTHQYDAAPAAFLKVNKGDEEFSTMSFDHGKPPKEIEELVNKVLSIKESVTKQ